MVGNPILDPKRFFGREEELRRLFHLIKGSQMQNGAIIGKRRSGKTSLLHYLCRITQTPAQELRPGQKRDWVAKPEDYTFIYVDFQYPHYQSREGLMTYLLQQMQIPVPQSLTLHSFVTV